MDIIDKLDLFTTDTIEEGFLKKVVRKGKITKKIICPVGVMKAKDGKCVMMKPEERKKRAKAAKKRGKLLHANIGVQKKANKKRAKSLRKRAMAIPNQGAKSLQTTGGES